MKKKILCVLFILIIIILIVIALLFKKKEQEKLNIHYFSIGNADSCLITYKDKIIMIDTGREESYEVISNYLDENKIEKIDYLIITHYDKDHVGSAYKIIDNYKIETILQNNNPKDNIETKNYNKSLEENNIKPITIDEEYNFEIYDVKFKLMGTNKKYEKSTSNNSSIITIINYNETKFMLAADIENDRIEDYIEKHDEQYDFIKIPHHGLYQKKLKNLLNNINPKYAVMTNLGINKKQDKTIYLLKDNDIEYYLTNKGSINVVSDGKNIDIQYE